MTTTTEDRRVADVRFMLANQHRPASYIADSWLAVLRDLLAYSDEQTALVQQLTEAVEAANAMAAAIRAVVWDTGLSREQCGDRTLVGLVRVLANKLDEARENRRGEYEHRTKAEALVRQHVEAQWQPIATAPKDGSAFLAYGIHDRSPEDAQRGVLPGDHWWSIILWNVWTAPHRWVFAKDGTVTWSEPTHWMPLPTPPKEPR